MSRIEQNELLLRNIQQFVQLFASDNDFIKTLSSMTQEEYLNDQTDEEIRNFNIAWEKTFEEIEKIKTNNLALPDPLDILELHIIPLIFTEAVQSGHFVL